ncbi:unnamed protein product [Urochloa decumbens]|uniref:F-box domain-containing protein n=1 Tax=Urochloa decumbens TaxID=240449 RepID=A0ABC9E2S4_9POAL
MDHQQPQLHLLPDDMLANILGRLPPRSLAASRCVGKHWCSLIDGRRLLRADLLPLRLDAFFFNPNDFEYCPSSFARPSRRFLLDFSDHTTRKEFPAHMDIGDHCNGLLLLRQMVLVNPATRQWANLPDFPGPRLSPWAVMYPDFYLVYDPFMVSPQQFEVFAIPSFNLERPPNSDEEEEEEEEEEVVDPSAEWPPSPFTTHVFCSRKWRWEERSFVRQGEPAGTIADMRRSGRFDRQAVYFQGALYVHCQNDSVMRIALSDDTYQVIEPPVPETTPFGEDPPPSYLGKSAKGVYFALLDNYYDGDNFPRCSVWWLNGQMEWVLKCNIGLVENIPVHPFAREYSKQWTKNYKKAAPGHDELNDEWDFDDGIVLESIDNNKPKEPYGQYCMGFLGFHPCKEIVFFCVKSYASSRAVSYHLNTSKVQDLGKLDVMETETSFPYTPCWMGELFENN